MKIVKAFRLFNSGGVSRGSGGGGCGSGGGVEEASKSFPCQEILSAVKIVKAYRFFSGGGGGVGGSGSDGLMVVVAAPSWNGRSI